MRQRGFTLIELMITVAILAIVCSMAVPFTGLWVDKNQVNQAAAQLNEAYGRAKAAALRNRQAVLLGKTAALVCVSGSTLSLQEANEGATAATCSGTATWTATLPKNIVLSDGNTALSCIAFNNRGLQFVPDDTPCSGQSTFTLSRGSANAQITPI